MNYIKITTDEVTQGNGLRVALWLSGCSHHCEGCFNPETWNPSAGKKFDETAKLKLYAELSKPYIQGLTLTGGDPLFPANRKEIASFILDVKSKFPDKDIWMWTGYKLEDLINEDAEDQYHTIANILKFVDVLIDGKFEINKRDITLEWRGSSNQRIIESAKVMQTYKVFSYSQTKDGRTKQFIPIYNLSLWKDGQYK